MASSSAFADTTLRPTPATPMPSAGEVWQDLRRMHRARVLTPDEPLAPATAATARVRAAIVLAGGKGTRLARMTADLYGEPRPKQYCAFATGARSLLQQTLTRTRASVPAARTWVVVARHYEQLAAEQLAAEQRDSGLARLFVQPNDAGTGAGVLAPLVELLVEHPDATVLVTPADHGFADEAASHDTLARAFDAADRGRVVLVGSEASGPSRERGWIVPGGPPDAHGLRRVERFVEKPAPAAAARLFDEGALWNTMLMVSPAHALLELFRARYAMVVRMFLHGASLPAEEREQFLDDAYATLCSSSGGIDLSANVLQDAPDLWVLPLARASGWTDLGTEERMSQWLGTPPSSR